MKKLYFILFICLSLGASAQYTMTYETISPICSNYCDGKIMITDVTGGTSPYTLTINTDTVIFIGDTVYFYYLCGDQTYNVNITDVSQSTSVITPVTVVNPPELLPNIVSLQNPTCSGFCNGSIQLSVTNGTPPYSFYLNTENNTTGLFTNLCGEEFSLYIVDSNGCYVNSPISLTNPMPLQLTEIHSEPSTCVSSDGTMYVVVNGGTPPYVYQWSNGSTHDTITNLTSGIYSITVTDSNYCHIEAHYSLNTFNSYVELSGVSPLCYGQNNGKVYISGIMPNGAYPMTYTWSNGHIFTCPDSQSLLSDTVFNAIAGGYYLTITDNSGNCFLYAYYDLTQPDSLSIEPYLYPIYCYGESNGFIEINVTGGTTGAGYNYIWSDGTSNNSIYNAHAGTYSVTVTDANNCTKFASYTLTQPDSFYVVASKKEISCFGSNDAGFIIKPVGGNLPYRYSFGDEMYMELSDTIVWVYSPGTYSIYVTDDFSCGADTISYTFTEPPLLVINPVVVTEPTCLNNDGSISYGAVGGTPPYSYWLDGASSSDYIQGLSETSYLIQVKDSHDCISDSLVQLMKQNQLPVIKGTVYFNQIEVDSSKVLLLASSQGTAAVMDTVTWNLGSSFYFTDLTPGSYFLKADYLDQTLNAVNTYYNEKLYWTDADTLTVNCDDTLFIDLNLDSLPTISGPYSLSGKVDFASSKMGKAVSEPVPGAEITIEQVPGPVVIKMAATDSTGKYYMNNLPEISGCNLRVDIPGMPLISTYTNLTVNASHPTITNLNFLVDTTLGGGIFVDTATLVMPVSRENSEVNVYPNPFHTSIIVDVYTPMAKSMFLQVFDATGKFVFSLPEKKMENNACRLTLNKNLFPQEGIYYIVMQIDSDVLIKKIIKE